MNKKQTTKKPYIAPAIEVIEIEPSYMVANTGLESEDEDMPGFGGNSGGGRGGEANRHRGKWGNLWE